MVPKIRVKTLAEIEIRVKIEIILTTESDLNIKARTIRFAVIYNIIFTFVVKIQ